MADTVAIPDEKKSENRGSLHANTPLSSVPVLEAWVILHRNRRLISSVGLTLIAACLIYCLFAPKEYEATARVALRSAPESALAIDGHDAAISGSFASGQVQLETLANVLRSEQVAWDVITRLKLYRERAFLMSFQRKFPEFSENDASADAKEYLLEGFHEGLAIESIPHTLVLSIRFRSRDAALSASVVNALIAAHQRLEADTRMQATRNGTEWLNTQLRELKEKMNRDDQQLMKYQREHRILGTPETIGAGRYTSVGHNGAITAVDVLNREFVNATTDRILREADYRAATGGQPELVSSGDGKSGSVGNLEMALLQQLHARRSDLEQEETQLQIEHGPNFPRVVEIRKQMQNADSQINDADTKLVERYHKAWMTSLDREQLLRRSLDDATGAGLKLSGAALKYDTMWQEANANREVYLRLIQRAEEAGMAAGSHDSALSVIDHARQPVKPVSPNLAVDLSITLFVAFWVGLAAALGRDAFRSNRLAVLLIGSVVLGTSISRAQAPTPSTSGLPTGVARIPQSAEAKSLPNAKSAPTVWNSGQGPMWAGTSSGTLQPTQGQAAPIGTGDMLEVTEAHTPQLSVLVRVSEKGSVMLPLAAEVNVGGLDERSAAHAIETSLTNRGMLLHPQVTVLVTAYAGQDVSVLGEVARPGVYSYTMHHQLLDLISAASGLSQNAGRLVTIIHRGNPEKAETVVLDPAGPTGKVHENPELMPGDTVQVNRAGLIYVVGDVIRPGAFPVEPTQTTTVVQVLSLAWGPAQNAALKKAVLIREQASGRTVTTLNLKRMLRGLDPDIPVRDRDILFVPDSMAKNLLNRSMESIIQSAAGVSIYAGLVYSQRF